MMIVNKEEVSNFILEIIKLFIKQPIFVRQAAIVNLKQLIDKHWRVKPNNFTILEEDKSIIKDSILDALIQTVNFPKLRLFII